MKKTVLATLVFAVVGINGSAIAANHTVSLGYEQAKVKDSDGFKMNGANVKYRLEFDSPVGLITSVSFKSGEKDYTPDVDSRYEAEASTFSIAAGPAFRLHDYVSVYGLVGIDVSEVNVNQTNTYYSGGWIERHNIETTTTSTHALFGAGVQVNPVKNLAIDLSYQQSKATAGYDGDTEKTYKYSGFALGVGYRF